MNNYWQQNARFKLLTIDTIKMFVSKELTKQVKKHFKITYSHTTLLITISQIVFPFTYY